MSCKPERSDPKLLWGSLLIWPGAPQLLLKQWRSGIFTAVTGGLAALILMIDIIWQFLILPLSDVGALNGDMIEKISFSRLGVEFSILCGVWIYSGIDLYFYQRSMKGASS